MARSKIEVSRSPLVQPDRVSTLVSQKRSYQGEEYNGTNINQEFDYVHDRLNKITIQVPGLEPLESTATLAETITLVNSLLSSLKEAGIVKA